MNPVDTVTLLNRLIVSSKDGERALRAAAMEAYHEDLRESLLAYSKFFGDAATELQGAVRKHGGHPAEIGTFDNTLHRTWMHLKAVALGRNEDELIEDVESDESLADALYDDALHWDMPPDVHALLERQANVAHSLHQKIRDFRGRATA